MPHLEYRYIGHVIGKSALGFGGLWYAFSGTSLHMGTVSRVCNIQAAKCEFNEINFIASKGLRW